MNKLYFAKTKPNAIIPSKREEDGGYDIYACLDEDEIVIEPQEIKFIPTGIASAFSSDYVLLVRERGSSGSKGLAVRCGVIDSGYRDEIFIAINNTVNKKIIITKDVEKTKERLIKETKDYIESVKHPGYETKLRKLNVEKYIDENCIIYPASKAIAQLILVPVPKVEVEEISYNDLLAIKSERGLGKLGSTNK